MIISKVLNVTYHSNVSNLKDTMPLLHLLRMVYVRPGRPKGISCGCNYWFPKRKKFGRHSCKRQSPSFKKNKGFCEPCKKLRCEIC